MITTGIDVGSSAIKIVAMSHENNEHKILSQHSERLRHRNAIDVVQDSYDIVLKDAGLGRDQVDYVATTGEGELVEFRTGHFYGMTAHARGGLELLPGANAVLDLGALHTRAIVMDPRGKVLSYRMTSQCASGSGQFLENIGRYLGVALKEIGSLSLTSQQPEKCSSICAVLAETDVINMVSRGILVEDILKGIHQSMAGRFVKLLAAARAHGKVALTGGLAADIGLLAALQEEAGNSKVDITLEAHPSSVFAGAMGAAIWAEFRLHKLRRLGAESLAS